MQCSIYSKLYGIIWGRMLQRPILEWYGLRYFDHAAPALHGGELLPHLCNRIFMRWQYRVRMVQPL